MFSGDPLRVIEGEVAGSGGDFEFGVEDFAGSVGGVDEEGYGGRGGGEGRERYEKDANYGGDEFREFHSFDHRSMKRFAEFLILAATRETWGEFSSRIRSQNL